MPPPEHPALPPIADAHREASESLSSRPEEATKAADSPDPKHQERYAFTFDWTDKRGRRWQGRFVNQVRSIYQRRIIGMTSARAMGGVPLASVDPDTSALIQMVAWLQTTLVEKPQWFADPDQLKDEALIAKVFKEVASHEAAFHGLDQPEAPGAPAG